MNYWHSDWAIANAARAATQTPATTLVTLVAALSLFFYEHLGGCLSRQSQRGHICAHELQIADMRIERDDEG